MPRSQRITCSQPPAITYSALIKNSSMVEESPRLSSTGLPISPTARSRVKFCMLRAPTWMMSTSAKWGSCSLSITSLTMGIPVFWRATRSRSSPTGPSP